MKNFRFFSFWAGLGALLAGFFVLTARADDHNPRIALVIGNSAYVDQALATPANDAGLVAATLQAAGFEVIGARDLDEKSLRAALRDFLDKAAAAGPDMQAFVYLSGRGLQYEGENFFAPIDAQIARDADVPLEAVRLSDFTHALAATPGKARIIVLDAARATPYAAGGSLAPGLALVEPEAGSLIAYNASPGAIGVDEAGPYGFFGKTLAGAMREGGVPIADVLALTRLRVNEATKGATIPWFQSKLAEPYFIFERAPDAPPPALGLLDNHRPLKSFPPAQAYSAALQRDDLKAYDEFLEDFPNAEQARRIRAIRAARREALFWRRAFERDTPRAYLTYLHFYEHGAHAPDAHRRLAMLAPGEMSPPSGFIVETFVDLPPPPREEIVYIDRPVLVYDEPNFGPPPVLFYDWREDDQWRDLPPPPPPRQPGFLPVLTIAIPLIIGARAYHDAGHAHGFAPPGPPPPPPVILPPPPLPQGVRLRPVLIAPALQTPVKPLPSLNAPAAQPPAVQVAPAPPPAAPPAPGKPAPAVQPPAAPLVAKPTLAPAPVVQPPSPPPVVPKPIVAPAPAVQPPAAPLVAKPTLAPAPVVQPPPPPPVVAKPSVAPAPAIQAAPSTKPSLIKPTPSPTIIPVKPSPAAALVPPKPVLAPPAPPPVVAKPPAPVVTPPAPRVVTKPAPPLRAPIVAKPPALPPVVAKPAPPPPAPIVAKPAPATPKPTPVVKPKPKIPVCGVPGLPACPN